MSTRINIIQRTALHIIIPIQGQWVCDIAKVQVLRQKICVRHVIISCPQVLALHVRAVALRIVVVHVVVLRFPKRHVAVYIVAVGLPDHTGIVCHTGHANICRILFHMISTYFF